MDKLIQKLILERAELNRKWIEQDLGRVMTEVEKKMFDLLVNEGFDECLQMMISDAYRQGCKRWIN